MDRRNFFRKSLFKIVDTGIRKVEELSESLKSKKDVPEEIEVSLPQKVSRRRKNKIKGIVFPPGSIKPVKEFKKKCTGCSDCIHACPHDVLFPVYDDRYKRSYPYLEPNRKPCKLCPEWFCIQACREKALKMPKKGEIPEMGRAILLYDFCLNNTDQQSVENHSTGFKTCEVCLSVCPIDGAIAIRNTKVKISGDCVGCGLCVEACPVFPKAISVKSTS